MSDRLNANNLYFWRNREIMKKLIVLPGVILLFFIIFWRWSKPSGITDQAVNKSESRIVNMTEKENESMDENKSEGKIEGLPEYASFKARIGYKNDSPYEDLITVKYSAEEMEELEDTMNNFQLHSIRMNKVYDVTKKNIKYECIRETDRGAYLLLQGEDGSLLWVFFNKNTYNILQVEMFHNFFSIKDFDFIEPGITRRSEIEDFYGELHTDDASARMSSIWLENCMVKEGILLIYFRFGAGPGMTKEDNINPRVLKTKFFPDGESAEASFETFPEMLPIDKHIIEY